MMRSVLALAMLVAGCIQPSVDGVVNPIKPPTTTNKIEQLAYEASQQRDAIGAKLLNQLADEIKAKADASEIIHDKWVMDRIAEANAVAAKQAGGKLQAELGTTLTGGDRLDAVKVEKAVRGIAAGRARAAR